MASKPLYVHIRDQIRTEYLQGAEPGTVRRLPPERELQARYGVSRPTIAKAIAALAADGELVSTQGSGRYIIAASGASSSAPAPKRIGYVASIATEILTQRTLVGIEREAARRGYRVVMANANNRVEQEQEAVRDLIASGVSGLVIYPVPRPTELANPDYLESPDLGVPVVLVDTAVETHPHTQFLFDNERLCYEITTWLIGHRHRRIWFAVGDAGIIHSPLRARTRGFRRAAADHGLDEIACRVIHYDGSVLNALADIADRAARASDKPTAILATEDRAAAELADHLEERGLRVPDEVLVVGFDDLHEGRRYAHQLPTTKPDFARLGERACERLIDLVEGAASTGRIYLLDVPLAMRKTLETRQGSDTTVRSASPEHHQTVGPVYER